MTKEVKVGGKFWQVLLFLLFMEWLCRRLSRCKLLFVTFLILRQYLLVESLFFQKCLSQHHKSNSVKNDTEFCELLSDWKRFCWLSHNWKSNSISHSPWPTNIKVSSIGDKFLVRPFLIAPKCVHTKLCCLLRQWLLVSFVFSQFPLLDS